LQPQNLEVEQNEQNPSYSMLQLIFPMENHGSVFDGAVCLASSLGWQILARWRARWQRRCTLLDLSELWEILEPER
jgi:hypothetical protein